MRPLRSAALSAVAALSVVALARAQDGVVIRSVVGGASAPAAGPAVTTMLTGTGLVLGRVVDADTGQSVPGATVTLGGAGVPAPAGPLAPGQGPPSAMSNGQGQFLIRELPAGSFTLSATAPGYLPSAYGWRRPEGGPAKTIDLADGQRVVDVELRMWKVGVITGQLIDDVGDVVVGATVRAIRRDSAGRLTMVNTASTDDRGVYRIANLTPGEYLVMVASTYSTLPRAVVDAARASPQIAQQLTREVTQLGMVANIGMTVGEMHVSSEGPLGGVPAPPPADDGRLSAYPTTFHPSSPTPAAATVVRVTSGAERTNVDLSVKLVRMFSVSGVLMGPVGPVANMGLRLVAAYTSSFTTETFMETATTASGPDGRFTFLGVPPGQYEIRALRLPRTQSPTTQSLILNEGGNTLVSVMTTTGPPPAIVDEPTLSARVPVDVGTRDVNGVDVTLAPGTRLVGQVEFEGAPPPAYADRQRLSIGLVSSDDRTLTLPPVAPVGEDLSFRTAEYPTGRFFVNVANAPAGWVAVEARAGSGNALVDPIVPSGAEVGGLVVTLSKRAPRLAGTVRGAAVGDPNATVVIFPADYRSWIDAGMPARRARTVEVRPTGAYEVAGLVPGSYAVVAVSAAAAVDVRNPETIETLARSATTVTLALGDTKTHALTVADLR